MRKQTIKYTLKCAAAGLVSCITGMAYMVAGAAAFGMAEGDALALGLAVHVAGYFGLLWLIEEGRWRK